jgi:stage II sporulation protein D
MSVRRTRRFRRGVLAALAGLATALHLAAAPAGRGQDASDADLEAASGGRTVRVRLTANGRPSVVDLPIELYVARVLAGEGEPRAAVAAQQALAVAIRTFAAANAGRHRRDRFDLCDTTHCQVLRAPTPASRAAALATASQILTYEGQPATVFYSASCGGRSEAPADVWAGTLHLPYLRSSEDEVHDADEPWTLEVTVSRVEQVLRRAGFEGRLRGVEVERRSASGRVTRLRLSGLRPDAMTGEDFRTALGARDLRSTQFSVDANRRRIRFTGRGYGHGVGLCVVGAGRRAARGESLAAILQHYYPGLQLEEAPRVARSRPSPPPSVTPDWGATRAHAIVRHARTELAAALGLAAPPEVRLEVHPSLEAFRGATARPWWVAFAVTGPVIEVPPSAILEQSSDGLEGSLRRAVAEVLIAEALSGQAEWVRVGAARHYAGMRRTEPPATGRSGAERRGTPCPSDAELTMPVSAAAHRDAELRAEACFARALAQTGDWQSVR